MSEMVERAARALWSERGPSLAMLHWDDAGEGWHTEYRQKARAAIAAMREPTEAMRDAGCDSGIWGPGVAIEDEVDASPEGCWRAMIDAALKD